MTVDGGDWPDRYTCVDVAGIGFGPQSLRAIDWADREPIRSWRNDQLDVLRQAAPLTADQQDRYFAGVVRPQLLEAQPGQVLVAILEGGRLIGYGGLVHISWPNRRAEISFMTETARSADEEQFRSDLRAFLAMTTDLAARLGLHRLTTETYEFRDVFLDELDRAGFVREGRLREHVSTDSGYVDSVIHGLLLS